jgi:hypothetical protein
VRASALAPWSLVVLAFGLALAITVMSGCADAVGADGRRVPGSPSGPGTRIDTGVLTADGGTDRSDSGDEALDASSETPEAGAQDAMTVYFDASPVPGTDAAQGADAAQSADAARADSGTAAVDAQPSFPDAQPSFPDAQPAFPDAQPSFPDASTGGTGEVWIELDYTSANTPRSPAFRYSNTPGWGASEWAAVNASWPEAWDRFNNMSVVNDPIGRSLEIGGSSELQLMLGFEELIAYSGATVRIEGRSRATSSQVTFDVYNPWNGCGVGGVTLGQQWQVQAVDLDLSGCIELGQGVQAIRVDPTNGTVALVRLRLTLHGAVY